MTPDLATHIAALLDAAPPLSIEQRDALTDLLQATDWKAVA